MKLRIKLRHRSLPPKPWKWEIHGFNLITVSHESYASQTEAHRAGRRVLNRLIEELVLPNDVERAAQSERAGTKHGSRQSDELEM